MGVFDALRKKLSGEDKIQPIPRYQRVEFKAPENASKPNEMRPLLNQAIQNSRRAALPQQNQTKVPEDLI